jgi:two-component system CheB/CheR fusion protein
MAARRRRLEIRAFCRIEEGGLGSMFEPFQQGTRAVRGRERGLGIGLTIVRELVAACRGTIRAHSDGVGRGTTMVVQLLRRSAEALRAKAEGTGSAEIY